LIQAFSAAAFLLRDKLNPAVAAGFFCVLAKTNMAYFPLLFRHSARDNALHRPTAVEEKRKSRNLPAG
jgi:hypothetical protein